MSPTTQPHVPLFEDEIPVGTVIAGYQLVRLLGRVERAHVLYEGAGPGDERVLVKLLSRGLSQDRDFRSRFERLMALRSSVTHPHLLQVLESGEFLEGPGVEESRLYVVSGFSDAQPLSELIARQPPEPRAALQLLGQAAAAVDAGHARDLVYPGLAPSEILVDQRHGDHVLVADCAGTGGRDGSTGYRSPEELRGEPLTPAGDVYALTCVLVECLTGRPPDELSVWAEPDDLPPSLAAVVTTGMAPDPQRRYATCAELVAAAAEALDAPEAGAVPAEAAVAADPWSPAEPGTKPQPPLLRDAVGPRWTRRRPSSRAVLAALAVGAVLGAGAGAVASSDDEPATGPSAAQRAETAAIRDRTEVVERATRPIDSLLRARTAGRRRLSRARRQGGQATVAESLSRSYATAARRLDAAGADGLARTTRSAGVAYDRLGAAARRGDSAGWRSAGRVVRRRDAALQRALRAFRRQGQG